MKRDILIKRRGTRTQNEIAKELDISQKHLSKIELGTRNPSIFLVAKFCELYKDTAENLFPDVF